MTSSQRVGEKSDMSFSSTPLETAIETRINVRKCHSVCPAVLESLRHVMVYTFASVHRRTPPPSSLLHHLPREKHVVFTNKPISLSAPA